MPKETIEAIDRVYKELNALSKEEFRKLLDEHGDGDIAQILLESGALEIRRKEMSSAEEIHDEAMKGGQTYHSLEVAKNTKGYNWTVKVAGADLEHVKKTLVKTEDALKEHYGNNPNA